MWRDWRKVQSGERVCNAERYEKGINAPGVGFMIIIYCP